MERTNLEIANSFKIRASSCMDIMAEGKGGAISVGAKTYCKKWLKEKLYNRRKDIKSKYISKGNETEEEGFTLMATELVKDMVYKNKERKSNEWVEGECDLFHNKIVYDNKSSWDLDTFPMFENEIPDKKYWWQLQCYIWLWNAESGKLCYTLNDANDEMVEQAIKWVDSPDERIKIANSMIYTKESFERFREANFALLEETDFTEIPDEKRIKSFNVEKDIECRDKIKVHVQLCREYILKLLNN